MTIKHSRFWRPEFDPRAEFVVAKPMKIGKKQLVVGQPFDKSTVDTRRLRQFYDQRYISQAGTEEAPKKPRDQIIGTMIIVPDYGSMTQKELRAWLTSHGVNTRPGAAVSDLIQVVKKFLNIPEPKAPPKPPAVSPYSNYKEPPRGLPA